jgi:hypothetical protein
MAVYQLVNQVKASAYIELTLTLALSPAEVL